MISSVKIELKWALIFSIVSLLWMLLEKVSGLHDQYIEYHPYLTSIFAIPAIWMMVLALKEKKKKYYNGNMSYAQGLISGIMLSLIIAIFSPLVQWITSFVITPNFFDNAIKYAVENNKSTLEEAKDYFNFQNYVFQGLIGAFVMGIATSAIAMIFIRTKQRKQQ